VSAGAILAKLCAAQAIGENCWQMHVDRSLCLGPPDGKHMSGGSCLAAIVQLLEDATGQPLIQASAQFLRAPPAGSDAEIVLVDLRQGRSISQASAIMRHDGAEAVRVLATLGARPSTGDHDWLIAPDVPAPDACPRLPFIRQDDGDLHTHLDMRLAIDPAEERKGRMAFWVRAPGGPIVAAFLTLIADYLPEAINRSIGKPAGAISLDNSIRILARSNTDWLLCVTQLSAIHDGLFNGRMTIFDEAGQTLAMAEQSGVVRVLG
jgi:acyl-CoA thioesterase II